MAVKRRGENEIKLKVFKTIANSLQNLATGVPGERKKAVGNTEGNRGCCSSPAIVTPVELVGESKPASKHGIKKSQPRRGQIKIKIFKMLALSVKNLAVRVAGGKREAAGNEGDGGGCFSSPPSPAVIVPVETIGGFKEGSRRERGEIKIKICKTIAGSVIEFSESGGKDATADGVGRWFGSTAGIVPMKIVNGCESEKLYDYI